MAHFEAYISPGWRKNGLANLAVVKVRGGGTLDVSILLVDSFCLGVKDVVVELDVDEASFRVGLKEESLSGVWEPMEPACARKLIDGALAYAESLGFAPHRDVRKARKVFGGIDADACATVFSFGRDGRPCFVPGLDDTEDRIKRVLGILEAKCGVHGFDFANPEVVAGDEDEQSSREKLKVIMDGLPATSGMPPFYMLSGMMTAMQLCPDLLMPTKLLAAFPALEGVFADEQAQGVFVEALFGYWNELTLVLKDGCAAGVGAEGYVVDIWAGDFDHEEAEVERQTSFALILWAQGFWMAMTLWSAVWREPLSRPELEPHWALIKALADPESRANARCLKAAASDTPPRTIATAVQALARALRPEYFGR